MSIMQWFAMITFVLTLIIMMLTSFLSKKMIIDREKSSPFECGFDPKSSARMPFSLQFFLIAMIFLIFDVEITLLLPLVITMKITSILSFSLITIFFIIILLIGLYHEWNQGALNWAL
uniref:NADH-ubiquinone oxidoreductase chain 3 n=1 Tax=Abscondita anceyi TaxID=2307266 RepID=A0A346T619_9COLE|nr:NADH dehydrogenase subunit 3 [Abscondita anceyi]UYG18655.1 NADH dehydrogenase subunit 3 [Abscondita chinensis]AXU05702.1 NADH dehydrogenase subunit 3 [Abscondita anceyi]UYG49019.1 NADH dehydrogenase subunit 3 [Abscondita chinensis]UYG49045.1 NADH dehydrogenase subunit 3 [Abscondita chinensis]UYG49058.1 NADH dehydrogenase subunit 3 [Abscondita chinensis]